MKKKQIIGLVIAVVLFTMCGMASVLTNTFSKNFLAESGFNFNMGNVYGESIEDAFPTEPYIAIVRVAGTIQEQTSAGIFEAAQGYQHNDTMEYVDSLIYDDNNSAILLYVDSPGGTVYESEELYNKLMEYKELTGRPVWAYMAHYAASGGYMISMASDYIYANKNTNTGSIGVIMSGYDMSGLYEKLGIRYVSITSGENKDSSSLSDEQVAIYQSQVNECYESFVQIVANGRNMTTEEVKALADGRTYTAQQALSYGLIDQISSFEDMQDEMSEEFDTWNYYEPVESENVLASLFSQMKQIIPKSEAQILLETADNMESGVLMYYAK